MLNNGCSDRPFLDFSKPKCQCFQTGFIIGFTILYYFLKLISGHYLPEIIPMVEANVYNFTGLSIFPKYVSRIRTLIENFSKHSFSLVFLSKKCFIIFFWKVVLKINTCICIYLIIGFDVPDQNSEVLNS